MILSLTVLTQRQCFGRGCQHARKSASIVGGLRLKTTDHLFLPGIKVHHVRSLESQD